MTDLPSPSSLSHAVTYLATTRTATEHSAFITAVRPGPAGVREFNIRCSTCAWQRTIRCPSCVDQAIEEHDATGN